LVGEEGKDGVCYVETSGLAGGLEESDVHLGSQRVVLVILDARLDELQC
jgi:hypothetical protein